ELNALLSDYAPNRQRALGTIIGDPEARARFFADYYAKFLSTPSATRVPTPTELATQEAFYQANGQRLEAVVANILRDPEYFPLSAAGSSTSDWLDKVYADLLGRPANDATAVHQLTFLTAESPPQPGKSTATLSEARFQVALQILNSTEYRQILIAGFFNRYL